MDKWRRDNINIKSNNNYDIIIIVFEKTILTSEAIENCFSVILVLIHLMNLYPIYIYSDLKIKITILSHMFIIFYTLIFNRIFKTCINIIIL